MFQNFKLDDFIIEFGLFFDDKFVKQLDNMIQENIWDTNIYDLSGLQNIFKVDKSYLLRDIENEIFRESTKLSDYEMQNLHQLL